MIDLTLKEAEELCYTIQNLNGSAALRRVQKKASEELIKLKRQAIFNEGARAARLDSREPTRMARYFERRTPSKEYGSMQIMRWYDGYQSIDSSVNHPYFDKKGKPIK